MFTARYGRGALDQVPKMNEGITPPTSSTGLIINPVERMKLAYDIEHSGPREHASIPKDPLEHRVVSPSSEIIEEGAAIFTDMTETILNALDQQMAMSSNIQKSKGLSIGDNQMKETRGKIQITPERYPDLFLPVVENHRISDHFCGYSDSLSADNNPMVLVKLESLSY